MGFIQCICSLKVLLIFVSCLFLHKSLLLFLLGGYSITFLHAHACYCLNNYYQCKILNFVLFFSLSSERLHLISSKIIELFPTEAKVRCLCIVKCYLFLNHRTKKLVYFLKFCLLFNHLFIFSLGNVH